MTKRTKNKIKKKISTFAKRMSIKVGERLILLATIYAIFRLFHISLKIGY